VATSRAKNVES